MSTIQVAADATPQQRGRMLQALAAAQSDGPRLIRLGPGRFDLVNGFALVRGTTLMRGAGRELTHVVGRGEGHSAWACMVEAAGPDVTLEDFTIRWEGGRGAQSQVVGYGSPKAPTGARLVLRRCTIIGGMFALYSWPGQANTIVAQDCTIRAARFPVCAGNSSGANGQFVELVRCRIECDSSLHDTGRGGKSDIYRIAYGIYARGGRVRAVDCEFVITGDRDMAAVLGAAIPADAAPQTRVELVRPRFDLEGRGAPRVAETETLQPAATITVVE